MALPTTLLPAKPATSGLVQWTSTDRGIVFSGANVVSWNDRVGASGFSTVNSPVTRAINFNSFNGNAGLVFTGGNNGPYMSSVRPVADDFTIFAVFNWTAASGSAVLYGRYNGQHRTFALVCTATGQLQCTIANASTVVDVQGPSVAADASQIHVLAARRTQSTGNVELFLDGRSVQQTATGITDTLDEYATVNLNFADADTSTITGQIFEVLAYNRVISDEEMIQAMRYLQIKYAIETLRR